MEKNINQYKQQIFRITAKNTKLNDQYIELMKYNIFPEKTNINLNKKVNSKSYKLGHLLLHETRSIMAFLKLQKRIYAIWKSEKETNTVQKNKQSKPKVEKRKKDQVKSNLNFEHIQLPNKIQVPIEISDIKDLKVACIMDTFTYSVFKPEANFEQLTPESWQREIESIKPDILFVESAWRGKEDLWKGKIAKLSQELIDIIVYCQSHNIRTIFWNKEDPFHFDDFINTAKFFDYIFTTDSDMIKQYKEVVTHDRVYLLPFACQPKLHNPIEKYERKDAFSFAGAFYPNFPKRSAIFESFIENLIPLGEIDIYDRNYNNHTSPFQYPEEYKPYIRGTLDYNEIDKAYKGYRYSINMSTITDSPSMFARRIFELVASNTLVISNYAKGVHQLFGDFVISTDDGKELAQLISRYRENKSYEKKTKLLALRKVMLEHTSRDRLNFIVSKLTEQTVINKLPAVILLAYVTTDIESKYIVEIFEKQSVVNKKLIIVAHKQVSLDAIEHKNIEFYGEDNNQIIEKIVAEENTYIACISQDDYYGENYLMDLVLATKYTNADAIGKKSYFQSNEMQEIKLLHKESIYKYTDTLSARTSIVHCSSVLDENIVQFAKNLSTLTYTYPNMFSIDEFNYCQNTRKNQIGEKIQSIDF